VYLLVKPRVQKLSAILAAIIVGSTGVVFALSQVRAAGASIYFSPTSRSVVQGATTSFTVRANTGGANVDTAALTVTYDAAKLEFAGVSAGSSPISTPVAPYGNSGSTITGAYYTTTPVSGDIVLATITFKARVSSGSAAVQLSTSGANGTLLASGGSDLGAALGAATVSFTAAPTTPAPSNPGTPAPTPTTPTPSKPTTNNPSSPSSGGSTSGNPATSTPTNNDPYSPAATQTEGEPVIAVSDVIPELKVGVFDKNNKPLKNKEVTLYSEPQTVKTDGDGFALFKNVPVGNHTLSYKLGNTTHEMPVYVATADAQTVIFDIAQRNLIIMWTLLAGLVLSVAALVVVLVRRSGGNFPFIKPRGPKTPTGPLGPNGATNFAPPQTHHWRSRVPISGMVVGGPDGVKKFTEDK